MLGLVNLPCECIDFYAQPKTTPSDFAFLQQRRNKSTISYNRDGRRIIDGKLVKMKEPNELWCHLLINLFIKSMAKSLDESVHEEHFNDSSDTSTLTTHTVRKPILSQNQETTMLTVMDNNDSTNSVCYNNKTKYSMIKANLMTKVIQNESRLI